MIVSTRTIGPALAGIALLFAGGTAPAAAEECDIDRPVIFGDLNYDSGAFHTALAKFILQHGYGCAVDGLPGGTIPMQQGVVRGDIDVVMEVWMGNPTQVWVEGEAAGKVVRLGTTFPDAEQGWWVPRYLVEGPDAPAPDLKSVTDLARYAELFSDPEEPGKGRFYNCPPGWQCEVANSKKLAAYGLADDFTNFRPGAGAALVAAMESAFLRKQPIVFYYWTPTAVMEELDAVLLDEPPYDAQTWNAMMAAENPTAATAYPVSEVYVGANKAFTEEAPVVAGFLNAYRMTSALTGEALAVMEANDGSADAAAEHFLKTREDIWTGWVDEAVAQRVKAALQ